MKKILTILILLIIAVLGSTKAKAETVESSLNALLETLGEGNYYQITNDVVGFWSNANEEAIFSTYLPGSTTETYSPNDRQWMGIPYITRTDNGRLWLSYMTGGYLEPHVQNYSVIYYSDDDGETWSDEFLIIDCIKPENHWYAPKPYADGGRMFFYLGSSVWYTDNADCENPSTELYFPKRAVNCGVTFSHSPVKLSNGVYVNDIVKSSTADASIIRIFGSRNGIKWEQIGEVESCAPAYKKFHEGGICLFGEDQLLLLSRLDGGTGLERSYSDDGGYTWSVAEADLDAPLTTPYSKCALATLSNGAIILVNNNHETQRLNMTMYISYDGGNTWPYQIELDGRYGFEQTYWGVSYPDIKVDKNDVIYCVWDERAPINEISMCRLTEADIVAGKVVSEGCYTFKTIHRNSNYYDMVEVEETFDHYQEVKKGTSSTSITSSLPTTLTYTDSKGNRLSSKGTWKCDNYDSEKCGYYTFYFEMDSKDEYLIMNDSLTKVYVKVLDDGKKSGCFSSIGTGIVPFVLLPMALSIFHIRKRKE